MAIIIGTIKDDPNLTGTAGADTIIGSSGSDHLFGLMGDDRLNGGIHNDLLDGGLGIDTADYSNGLINPGGHLGPQDYVGATAGVIVNLSLTGSQNTGGAGSDMLVSIENLTGTNFSDTLSGNSGNNVLSSLSGNDQLFGDLGDDRLDGGTGADAMTGGRGNDTYVVDDLRDAVYDPNVGGHISGGTDTVESSITYTLGTAIENLTLTGTAAINGTGTTLSNVLSGNSGNNELRGLEGNDQLFGARGNDRLDGGTGADAMTGGRGNDTYVVDDLWDNVSEPDSLVLGVPTSDGTDTVESSITYRLLSETIENLTLTGTDAIGGFGNTLRNVLTGNSGNNVLSGESGNDQLDGGLGNDTLFGGDGSDTASYATATAGVTVDISGLDGSGQSTGGAGNDTLLNIEHLTGSNFDDSLRNDFVDGGTLNGGAGNDILRSSYSTGSTLNGDDGDDKLYNDGGNSTLNGGAGNDVLSSGDSRSTLNGGDGDDVLSAGIDQNTLNGGAGNDKLSAGLGANTLNGDAGDDVLTTYQFGFNTLNGGAGADTFRFEIEFGDFEVTPVITDFTGLDAGFGDQIDLSEIDAISGGVDDPFTYIDSAAFTAAGQLRYAGDFLQGNTDGDAAAEFEIQLVGAPALVVSDILL